MNRVPSCESRVASRKRIYLALAFCLCTRGALAESPKPEAPKPFLAAYLLALAADAATTDHNLEQGQRELNPLLRPLTGSRPARVLSFSLSGAVTLSAAYFLQHGHHARAARALLAIETADHASGAAWNLTRANQKAGHP